MVVLIITNVLAVILETVAELAAAHATFFYVFELFSVTVFTVEYCLRIWSVVENEDVEAYRHPVKGRIKEVGATFVELETVQIGESKVTARRYRLERDLAGDVWFDGRGIVVLGRFPLKASTTGSLRLISVSGGPKR